MMKISKRIFLSLLIIASKGFCQNVSKPFIKEIYPTIDSIPVNILRFYIEFSEPIREQNSLSHIYLKAAENGKKMTLIFFDNNDELWNANRTKLTLIVDPARVKTGLKANEEMGRAFEAGKYYCLAADSLFTTMSGKRLASNFTKKFVAVEADTIIPAICNWAIKSPEPNSKQPLQINFNEPLDHISAQGYLIITDNNGKKINGNIVLKKNEMVWQFTPTVKWKRGEYKLLINYLLEDIAANNLKEVFDHKEGTLKTDDRGKLAVVKIIVR